jgi:hypothetical protein
MKTIQKILIVTIIILLPWKTFCQQKIKGTLHYSTSDLKDPDGTNLLTANATIPLPTQGLPSQIKAVITTLDNNEKNSQRFIFITSNEKYKNGPSFKLQNGNIVANLGSINPLRDQVKLFLVYKVTSIEGKASFTQQEVEPLDNLKDQNLKK